MEISPVRKKRPTYITVLNFLVFGVFLAALWFFVVDMRGAQALGLSRTVLEMVLLQSVSLLLMLGALQLNGKVAVGWRPALLAMAFVALSESSLVAFLTPIG